MLDDMSSWTWSSWLLFAAFLMAALAIGYAVRDILQQRRDRKPPTIVFGEPFYMDYHGRIGFYGRVVRFNQEAYGPSTLEAVDEATLNLEYRLK